MTRDPRPNPRRASTAGRASKYCDGMKVTLLGGGGFRAPMVYAGLLRLADELGVTEVALHDVAPVRLEQISAVLQGMESERGIRLPVTTTTEMEAAVDGASFVLCAIRPGGLAARAHDERLAERAGLLGQETVGAAGILFALRTIPEMRRIAETVLRRAPGAWFLNFTNPAGIVTEALMDILGDRAIGICDSPAGLCERTAQALGRDLGTLRFGYAGLNHLGWLAAVRDAEGVDLLPGLLADPERLAGMEEGRLFGPDWLCDLGVLPNEYLFYFQRTERARLEVEHIGQTRGEVLQHQQDVFYTAWPESPDEALALWRQVRGERERTYLQEAGSGVHAPPAGGDEGGYGVVAFEVMTALMGRRPTVAIVNCLNRGAIPWLDRSAVVEVPSLIDGSGVNPLATAELPPHARGMVETVKEVERLVLEASIERSRTALRKALALHPLGGGIDTASRICQGRLDGD